MLPHCAWTGASIIICFTRSCKEYHNDYDGFSWDERRGNPAEFDPGPSTRESLSWLKLYGQAPNYRTIGSELLGGGEKFRWQMGPMWYRGRLGKNQVKVFIVGQEGAQDENITNRAFTGSTGTRMQKFINHLGIYESYLFMNTYVYTIKGQRVTEEGDPMDTDAIPLANYQAIEQGKTSPIVQYRNSLFDNVIEQNPESIALFIGVGGGGKESLATWINSNSANHDCMSWNLGSYDTTGLVQKFAKKGRTDSTVISATAMRLSLSATSLLRSIGTWVTVPPVPITQQAHRSRSLMNWPNFQEIDSSAYYSDESFGFGPSYRGNTTNPKVIIIADQMGHADLFSTRALTDEGGQRLQSFLKATGLEKDGSYLILRSLPVDTIGIDPLKAMRLATTADSAGKNAAATIANVIKLLPDAKAVVQMGPVALAIGSHLTARIAELNIPQLEILALSMM